MERAELVAFTREIGMAVIATLGPYDFPQAALVGVAVTEAGEFGFAQESVNNLADTDVAFMKFMHELQFTGRLVAADYAHDRVDHASVNAAIELLEKATDGWMKVIHAKKARERRPSAIAEHDRIAFCRT